MENQTNRGSPILLGDSRLVMQGMEPESYNCCVTSPPYWGLRDYGVPPSEWPAMSYSPMSGLSEVHLPTWTGCLGLEPTPELFVGHMVQVFREVWRVLRNDGTLWLNFGDSYASSPSNKNDQVWGDPAYLGKGGHRCRTNASGLKPKDLIGIPWRVAFALQADGWYLRMDIIWSKTNAMPESVKDRPTKAHEYIFLLSKSERYYYDSDAIKEKVATSTISRLSQDVENQMGSDRANGGAKKNGAMKAVGKKQDDLGKRTYTGFNKRYFGGSNSFAREVSESPPPGQHNQHRPDREDIEYSGKRNKRSVWTVATNAFPEAHFAVFPTMLIEPCILAGCPVDGHVLDPFGGSGTTRKVSLENNRECTTIDINPNYNEINKRRTATIQPKLF